MLSEHRIRRMYSLLGEVKTWPMGDRDAMVAAAQKVDWRKVHGMPEGHRFLSKHEAPHATIGDEVEYPAGGGGTETGVIVAERGTTWIVNRGGGFGHVYKHLPQRAGEAVEAHQECPEGKHWDETKRRCIPVPVDVLRRQAKQKQEGDW